MYSSVLREGGYCILPVMLAVFSLLSDQVLYGSAEVTPT